MGVVYQSCPFHFGSHMIKELTIQTQPPASFLYHPTTLHNNSHLIHES